MNDFVELLVVEDEPVVASFVTALLEGAGYHVRAAASGAEALCVIDQHGGALACVITDVRLGAGPDGWEVARAARRCQPDIPVIYVTGDSAAQWATLGVTESHLIQKPFTAGKLTSTVAHSTAEKGAKLVSGFS